MDTPPFFCHFYLGNNFLLLLYSLEEALPKWGLLLSKKICSLWSKFILLKVDPTLKREEKGNSKVASPVSEIIPFPQNCMYSMNQSFHIDHVTVSENIMFIIVYNMYILYIELHSYVVLLMDGHIMACMLFLSSLLIRCIVTCVNIHFSFCTSAS